MDRTTRPLAPAGRIPAAGAATDEELMARFRDGESNAFDELLDRHKRAIYAYLRRSTRVAADADDLFQEVFIKVIRAAPRWEEKAKVTTWIYTIARNVLIDAARRRGTHVAPISLTDGEGEDRLSPIEVIAAAAPAADRVLLEREHADAVEALVAELPAEQRDCFLLKREGLTFEQIAEATATPKNTVKSRLRYALEKLRAGLGERGLLPAPGGGEVRS